MLTQHRDEELVLFLEMRHRKKESDHNNTIGTTTMSSQGYIYRRNAADNFLYSETEKSDYDWLVTPPGSPTKSLMNQLDTPDTNPMNLISLLGNCLEEENDNNISKNRTIGLKRPSSSNSSRATSRPSTPTKRSMVPTSRITSSSTSSLRSTSRPSTPTKRPFSSSGTSHSTSIASRATLASSSPSSSRSTSRASTPTKRPSSSGTSRATSTASRVYESTCSSRSMSRPSTPTNRPPSSGTSRANLTASRVTSATSSSRAMSRPSTPTSRPSSSGGTTRANLTTARATIGSATSTRSNIRPMTAPSPKPGSRSSTPTRRPSTPSSSSTILKSKATKPVDIPVPSPILRSRPWEPYEMPGFSLEAPSNLRTTLPDRPKTASSRGTRPGSSASSSRSTSIEPVVSRKQSCSSPSRNQAQIINSKEGGPSLRGRRAKTGNEDSGSSHVVKSNQMAENTRKLAPTRLTENRGGGVKSNSSSNGYGFGRNLSKSSIDMALRHLGVKRGSMTGNLRPQVTKVSGTGNKRPMSSSGSSESSVNILCLDGSDDNLSDISYT